MGIDDCIHKKRSYDAKPEMCLAGAHTVEIIVSGETVKLKVQGIIGVVETIGFMVSGQKVKLKVQGITGTVVTSCLQLWMQTFNCSRDRRSAGGPIQSCILQDGLPNHRIVCVLKADVVRGIWCIMCCLCKGN